MTMGNKSGLTVNVTASWTSVLIFPTLAQRATGIKHKEPLGCNVLPFGFLALSSNGEQKDQVGERLRSKAS